MACQSKEAKKWLCFYLIHLIFDNFEVNYLSLPESYHTNLITLYNPSFHKFVIMTWSFYQLHLSRNSGSQRSLGPTIASNVSVCSSRYEACGKFEEQKRCVRVARGVAESNSGFLSALQTSQVLHISMNTQLTHEPIVL